MKDFVFCTVPHTGTTFVETFFFKRGWHDGLPQDKSDGRTIHRNHCTEGQYCRTALNKVSEGHPLVTTIRHPYLVEESWKQRSKEIGPMIQAFDLWLERIYPRADVVLSVDSPHKELLLANAAEYFDVSPATDWKPERSVGATYDLTYEQCVPSDEVVSLGERMSSVLGRFYD